MTIPPLETERLTLRGHRREDFAACAALWADPIVTRYIGGKPFTPQEAWSKMLRYVGHWPLMGFGYWAVEERATSRFLGEVGFADFKREIQPSIENVPELGWALTSISHGKGYATEALQAAIAWGDQHFANRRTVCLIDPENAASLRVAQKCGYLEILRTSYSGHPTILFERK